MGLFRDLFSPKSVTVDDGRPRYVLLYKNKSTQKFERNLSGREPFSFEFVQDLIHKHDKNQKLTLLSFPSFASWQETINQWKVLECEIKVNGLRDFYYIKRVN